MPDYISDFNADDWVAVLIKSGSLVMVVTSTFVYINDQNRCNGELFQIDMDRRGGDLMVKTGA